MNIKASKAGSFVVFSLDGKLDSTTSGKLTEYLDKAISNGDVWIILDMEKVPFVSSAGIGAIMKALSDTSGASGDLRILKIQSDVKKVFSLVGFDTALKFFDNLERAIA